jgi:predicted ATP-dependent endonuclease of OLD family
MRLKSISLYQFRGYKNETVIPIDKELTGLIGKNDAGKSTILEALDHFFNDTKMDPEDWNIYADKSANFIRIGCIFTDLPKEIIVDENYPTSFQSEYLTNKNGCLEIIKEYKVLKTVGKPAVYIKCLHPSIDKANNLHSVKITELRKLGKELGVENSVEDERVSSLWRKAIWNHFSDLELQERLIDVSDFGKESKSISDKIDSLMPVYALFKSDRPSNDDDPEAKDPMQAAVKVALKEYDSEIKNIQDEIIKKVEDVANRTLDKVHEMNEELAKDLTPKFKKDPKWSFDFTIDSDDGVPLNKRGSGVRRLILLNFFRAEAEKDQSESGKANIIYAIEEPETSQHPDYQIMLMKALEELSGKDNCQILITTHVPALAGLLPTESIRYINTEYNGEIKIEYGSEDVLKTVAENVGVLPEKGLAGAKAIVMVEGPSDVTFLSHASEVLKESGYLPNTLSEKGIVPVITGGCHNLKHWITKNTANEIGLEWAIFMDSDKGDESKYQRTLEFADEIKQLGKYIHLTRRKEPENYINPRILVDQYGHAGFQQGEDNDAKHEISAITKIKRTKVIEELWPYMTAELILEMDIYEEGGHEKHELVDALNQLLNLV